jgi:FixJ family two-component response regulator
MKEGVRPTSPASAAEEPIVFVIDDDPLMLGGLSSLFRSIGLRVEAFASATELLQHPLPAVPSCLVLDIRLPRLSGFDLQAELNRLGIKIPIIFITGHGDVPMSVKAMKAGAIDFLIKPVREQEMLDAVTGALERDRKRRAEEKSNSDVPYEQAGRGQDRHKRKDSKDSPRQRYAKNAHQIAGRFGHDC